MKTLTIEERQTLVSLLEKGRASGDVVVQGGPFFMLYEGNGLSIIVGEGRDADTSPEGQVKKDMDYVAELEEEAGYPLSKNQVQFIKDVKASEYDIRYNYSGRYMYGRSCPSVNLDRGEHLETRAKTNEDSMGKGYVIYAMN